ncbi:MAG: hypothetical protein ACT4P6_12195 [Gemmatimonadaceae bacterium]
MRSWTRWNSWLGAYVALAARRGSIGLQADTRAIVESEPGGCPLDDVIVQVGENLYERRPGWQFTESTPRVPFAVSTLRAVLEFGPSLWQTSAKAGGGVIWGKNGRHPTEAALVRASRRSGVGTPQQGALGSPQLLT